MKDVVVLLSCSLTRHPLKGQAFKAKMTALQSFPAHFSARPFLIRKSKALVLKVGYKSAQRNNFMFVKICIFTVLNLVA